MKIHTPPKPPRCTKCDRFRGFPGMHGISCKCPDYIESLKPEKADTNAVIENESKH